MPRREQLDLWTQAQLDRAERHRQVRRLLALATHHQWAEERGGWACVKCDVSLSDLAPVDAAAKITRQPCAEKGGAAG